MPLLPKRPRFTGIGIPIIELKLSDDHLRFIKGIPEPIRQCLLSEYRPRIVVPIVVARWSCPGVSLTWPSCTRAHKAQNQCKTQSIRNEPCNRRNTSYKVADTSHMIALILWGRYKMAAISQTTFSNAFSWIKMYGLCLRFHWSLFLRFELTIFHHWFR